MTNGPTLPAALLLLPFHPPRLFPALPKPPLLSYQDWGGEGGGLSIGSQVPPPLLGLGRELLRFPSPANPLPLPTDHALYPEPLSGLEKQMKRSHSLEEDKSQVLKRRLGWALGLDPFLVAAAQRSYSCNNIPLASVSVCVSASFRLLLSGVSGWVGDV